MKIWELKMKKKTIKKTLFVCTLGHIHTGRFDLHWSLFSLTVHFLASVKAHLHFSADPTFKSWSHLEWGSSFTLRRIKSKSEVKALKAESSIKNHKLKREKSWYSPLISGWTVPFSPCFLPQYQVRVFQTAWLFKEVWFALGFSLWLTSETKPGQGEKLVCILHPLHEQPW